LLVGDAAPLADLLTSGFQDRHDDHD
jgi:hypothetical protein